MMLLLARRPPRRRPSHAVSRSYAAAVVSPAELSGCSERSSPYAVGQGLRIDNPVHGVVKFAEGRRQRRLADDEYRMLGMALSMATLGDIWKPAVAATSLLALTGWRRGEVSGLRWSEVDLPRRTARLTDTKTGASLRPLSDAACVVIRSQPRIGDIVFASRSGDAPIVGYRKMWLRIAKLGDLPSDITPHVLRHSFASLAADLGYNEPTIASLLGHKTHSITSTYVHSADAVLLTAADAVANATMRLMTPDQAQPQLRDQRRDGSVVWDGITSL
jgi:integrase